MDDKMNDVIDEVQKRLGEENGPKEIDNELKPVCGQCLLTGAF